MSWQTSIDRWVSVVQGTSGVRAGSVREAPLTKTDRAARESASGVATATQLQLWELFAYPIDKHHGCDGFLETEATFEWVAHHFHADDVGAGVPSLRAFRSLIQAVNARLLDPAVGFPQAKDGTVLVVEAPTLAKLPSGQSEWRARYRLDLWDTSST